MLALRTLTAGVVWWHGHEQAAAPWRLVRQLPTQLERAGVQDGAVQPGLLGDALPRLCFPAFARGTQVLDLQVFDKHDGVVFADVLRGLVHEILSDVGNFAVQPGDAPLG